MLIYKNQSSGIIAAVFLSMLAPGCSAIFSPPEKLYSIGEEREHLRSQIGLPDFKSFRYYTSDQQSTYRNNYIAERMYSIDIFYSEYFSTMTREKQGYNLAGGLAVSALTSAVSLVGSKGAKEVLAATAGIVNAGKTEFDKEFLASKTIQILQNKMESSRLDKRQSILQKMKKNIIEYSLAESLSDLEDYYRAGTIAGALEDLSADAGAKSAISKEIDKQTSENEKEKIKKLKISIIDSRKNKNIQ